MLGTNVRKIEVFVSDECPHSNELIETIDLLCSDADKRSMIVHDVLEIPEHELNKHVKYVPAIVINEQYAMPKVGDECFRFVSLFFH